MKKCYNIENQILSKFKNLNCTGNNKWTANCPSHNDTNPSLSISIKNDKILLKCFAGCSFEQIVEAVGLKQSDLCLNENKKNTSQSSKTVQPCNTSNNNTCQSSKTVQPCNTPTGNDEKDSIGCTLELYADFKEIPEDFLKSLGLHDVKISFNREKIDALEIPYHDEAGKHLATRHRTALYGKDKFRWKKGNKTDLYGLNHLDKARERGFLVIVEGESDCHTLFYNDFPTIGVPGASNWKESRDAVRFKGIETIYLIKEPDTGGDTLLKSLMNSSLASRLRIVDLGKFKDPSELWLDNRKAFKTKFQGCLDRSLPLAEFLSDQEREKREKSFVLCEPVARTENILDALVVALLDIGVVGEERLSKLLFLSGVTRLFQKPVSVTVVGCSSSGKSYTTETILEEFFPPEAYYPLSASSEKALIYSKESFRHRILVIREWAGIQGDFMEYIIRSLLSEGKISYEVTELDPDTKQYGARKIEKEGPTALFLTTTKFNLNPENENRAITVATDESPEQTRRVLLAIAEDKPITIDLRPWLELQNWLSFNVGPVFIPYAKGIVDLLNTIAVRLRRDFSKFISLIKAHALIHQLNRDRDKKGRIVATIDDYRVVYELVNDLIGYGIEASVPKNIRDVVKAVEKLTVEMKRPVSVTEVSDELEIHKATASRNLKSAGERGFLKNQTAQRGMEAQWVLHEHLPEDSSFLPSPEELMACYKNTKIFKIKPVYSIDQYFFAYNEYLKEHKPDQKEAYRHYMEVCDQKNRRHDNDREAFYIEYGDRYLWADMFREYKAGLL